MAITWITPAGDLGTFEERVTVNIPIQASTDSGQPISYTIIAGKLPIGCILRDGVIKGAPGEVTKVTQSKFVIRANDGTDGCMDRTFSMSIDGADFPEWITTAGYLNVGNGDAYFVLDDSEVNFQLEATDKDLIAGETLKYYIVPNSGLLPPGLLLSETGNISGFTQPVQAVAYNSNESGAYDTHSFDTVPLDIAKNTSTGFDTYFYDNTRYDFSEGSRIPDKLSRSYTFSVAITDGINAVHRTFKIYVVTEEFLQADNTLMQVDTNLFQADSSRDRQPLWITPSYLGKYRANNFLTLPLDVYDPPTLSGTITYFLVANNPDGTPSTLPPGLTLDTVTGDLSGVVPYQAAVTENYKFTMRAVNFPVSLAKINYVLTGDWSSLRTYNVNDAVVVDGLIYICIEAHLNKLPTDTNYWILGVSSAERTFNVDIIGEIESSISWITPSDRGTIKPNDPSNIYVEAKSLLYGGRLLYTLESGSLPPGLEFLPTGLVQGKVKQFQDNKGLGLTRFFDRDSAGEDSSTLSRDFSLTFDQTTTSFDKEFKFTVKAQDGANFAESLRTFKLKVVADNQKVFSNIYVKALQSKQKRLNWFNFITDSTIFKAEEIYRYGDQNYGIQSELKALLFAGIESKTAQMFVSAMGQNHYNKRFTFGNIKQAIAKDPLTNNTLYEVVYVDLVDDLEKNGKSISQVVELKDNINSKIIVSYDAITIDSDVPLVSDSDHQRIFPNSVNNMRKRIRTLGERDRGFLPLWMRSIQDTATYELGFTKALVLCYTKPGKSQKVVARIKANGFDFKTINFEADRYIVDIIDGQIEDKYIVFPQRGEKRP